MSIHIALNHITHYQYERPIQLGPQIVRLRPAPHSRTPVLSYSLNITPKNYFINWQQDPQGNYLARLVFPEKTNEFKIEVDLTADMTVINPFDFFLEEYAEEFPFAYETWLKKELKPFLGKNNDDSIFNDYVNSIPDTKKRTIDYLIDVNQKIQKDVSYLIRMEPGVQSPVETLTQRSGSCRDSAWLLVNILRAKGLATRFVSGYLIQLKADVKALDGPSGTDVDFTDLHAWTEVYLPGAGWIGLDPTSGLLTGEGHIPLVATPEPSSAAPITGALENCKTEFKHTMTIARSHEDARVTKPYTESQWSEILKIGDQVDAQLDKDNVQLTMGGEPTFVSIDDMEGKQWNTEALGDEKRELSERLFQRLKKQWTQGALIVSTQGKWYPGEPLPRWVLSCYWRKDQKPIWTDEQWLADETQESSFTHDDAQQFVTTLAEQLNVDTDFIIPAYENVGHYLLKENQLPVNLDPADSKLKDPIERRGLAELFEKGIGEIVGYTLPLIHSEDKKNPHWISGEWRFRTPHLFLIPGDSPMGLRIPLDSLPWAKPEDQKNIHQRDPLESCEDLEALQKSTSEFKKTTAKIKINKGESDKNTVRTALCIQQRSGRIYVFLPPLSKIEEYLELIKSIEETARQLKVPVVIEGYPPPFDARIDNFKITPDPGVIEVNVAPAASWKALIQQTEELYDQAFESRLGTEKFMLDGRHSGTGGGNHIVLGGSTPAQSPFLRRPDLLASFVAYWNNHPALSYLFSGLFIGPTSQAPRVDEGRRDSIYELEIAIAQMNREIEIKGKCSPWTVDRLFRNLLVDGTGNTHRAELCIDKMYSPDSSTGRLGLLEFRGFEMPPHARMSIAQQLLIRALVARFWTTPYTHPLIRWNTSLHDRYLLPHFIKKDFQDVLTELNDFGFPLTMEYFAPHFEFRFPKIGSVNYQGVELQLRTAIEPWYVLGEEPAGGGTSRFVDSSVERLQVKVQGVSDDRYIVTCNGEKIPLHFTGNQGEYVAGIRYRAWQPPSCLHPTIPVHAPLTFDVLDSWSMRSIGGCKYHVAHPGGRNYDTFPINANEAEARRVARFFKIGHTPGELSELPKHRRIQTFQ